LLVMLTLPRADPPAVAPPVETQAVVPESEDADVSAVEVARVWAELQNNDHLVKVREEENRRKVRAEDRRVARRDDHPSLLTVPSTSKH
jgi:hypothetical protein